MLRQYEQLSALRLWLVKRVERGLPIPDSMEETTELVRLDPTGFPAKKFRYGTWLFASPKLSFHSIASPPSSWLLFLLVTESSADTRERERESERDHRKECHVFVVTSSK